MLRLIVADRVLISLLQREENSSAMTMPEDNFSAVKNLPDQPGFNARRAVSNN
jgi:hypothetical protein